MPCQRFRHLADLHLVAMYAYLNGVPPIRNRVPAWIPPAEN
jgi:hypothetical protein